MGARVYVRVCVCVNERLVEWVVIVHSLIIAITWNTRPLMSTKSPVVRWPITTPWVPEWVRGPPIVG